MSRPPLLTRTGIPGGRGLAVCVNFTGDFVHSDRFQNRITPGEREWKYTPSHGPKARLGAGIQQANRKPTPIMINPPPNRRTLLMERHCQPSGNERLVVLLRARTSS